MKFAIFREIDCGKRKFLVEWNRADIVAAFKKEGLDIEKALNKIIKDFKKESIKIP